MAEILAKLRGVLGEVLTGQADAARGIRELFEHAQRRNRKIELEPMLPSTASARPASREADNGHALPARKDAMIATIEQVREDDLVISQPMIGGRVRPLVAGEPLQLGLIGPDGRHVGRTKCLGRIRIKSGGQQVMYGYRLAFPAALEPEDRRQNYRIGVEFDLAVLTELYVQDTGGPIVGVLMDLSAGGARARLRCPDVPRGFIGRVQAALRMTLPEPVGTVEQVVRVNRIERCARTGHNIVAIEFTEEIESLERLIRALEIRRAKRRR